jgi:hypothetical protein
MNKLFVKVGCSVPISFKINNQLDWTGLHIRGLLVYDNPDESRKPVVRCNNHKDPLHKSNTGHGQYLKYPLILNKFNNTTIIICYLV